MEIDVTEFFSNACPRDYSASQAEIGQHAGESTWQAALDDSDDYKLLRTRSQLSAFVDYLEGFGAWTPTQLDVMTDKELNALCIQFVSADMREGKLDDGLLDWDRYRAMAEQGSISGRLYRDDAGHVWYNIAE